MFSIFYDWFKFLGNLFRYETNFHITDHLSIWTLQTQKYGRFIASASTIRS